MFKVLGFEGFGGFGGLGLWGLRSSRGRAFQGLRF